MKLRSLVVVLGVSIFCGCGGGGGGGGTNSLPIHTVNGTTSISTALEIDSAYGDGPEAVTTGSFATSVSGDKAHIIYAVNANGDAVGLAVSVPGQPTAITPESTAIGLIFGAPNIYTSSPTDALTTISEIKALSSFPALKQMLVSASGTSLVDVFSISPNRQLVLDVFTEWFQAHQSQVRPQIVRDTSKNSDLILCDVDDRSESNVGIHLENADLRVLQVVRKKYFYGGAPIIEQLPDMPGAEGASLIGLITHSLGTPSFMDLRENMSPSGGAYRVDYFFRSFGSHTGPAESVPSDIATTWHGSDVANSATIKTVVWYFLLPAMDAVTGFSSYLTDKDTWQTIVNLIINDTECIDALNDVVQSFGQGKVAIASSLTHAAKTIFEQMVTSHTLQDLLTHFFKKKGFGATLKIIQALATIKLHVAINLGLDLGQLIGIADQVKNWHVHNEISVTNDKTVTLDYPTFSDLSGLVLNGNAAQLDDRLRIASTSAFKAASVFGSKQPVAAGFDTTFRFRISSPGGTGDTPGADGFAFIIQNAGPNALGGTARDMGYGGIGNSVAVEFDTYKNAEFGDPSANHISVQTRGTQANSADHQYSLGTSISIPNLKDGAVHYARIRYDGSRLTVYVDSFTVPSLEVNLDLQSQLQLDGGKAYLGFTAATGSSYENVDLLSWQVHK